MGKILLIVAFALLLVICGPLATIWSLNTLFGLAIPVSFDTWMATFWLATVISGGAASLSRKK